MATCDRCGTHLWVGSTDCPTCNPRGRTSRRRAERAAVRAADPVDPAPPAARWAGDRRRAGAVIAGAVAVIVTAVLVVPLSAEARGPAPTREQLHAQFVGDGIDDVRASCMAGALLSGLTDDDWERLDADEGVAPEVQAKVDGLTAPC